MLVKINIPDIGFDELEVTDILVKIGDHIEIEQSLIIVEGKKVSLEIPSPETGIVKDIRISIGDKVSTGNLIMIVENNDQELKNNINDIVNVEINKNNNKILKPSISELKTIYLSDIGSNEFKIIDIMVCIGTNIINNTPLIKLYGNNMLIEFISSFSGVIKAIHIKLGDLIKSNALLMTIENNASCEINKNIIFEDFNSKKNNNYNVLNNNFQQTNIHATPLIRRLAREFGINLSKINGTGNKNRILREDIIRYVRKTIKSSNKRSDQLLFNPLNINSLPKIDYSKFGEIEEVELTNIQKEISSNLTRNWITIPHVTMMENIDITEVENFRKQQNNELNILELNNIKITILVFIIKAVAYSLKEMPYLNSSISSDCKKIIIKKYINIGIAVDTNHGLCVPVIRNVNKKNILELSKELIIITQKARLGKLTTTDIQGGSFTISNLGNIGTINFTPIINGPEVAILGISRSLIKPIWNGKKFVSRLILPISLSFDHRVINGADGARFITRIATLMSDIRRLII